jgi:ABC-type transporter Mla MlaB component
LLDGTLTVRDVVSVKATLLAALANQQAVQVDCRKAESVDLSFIQLLLSARLTARRAGKHFMLAAPAEGALRSNRAAFCRKRARIRSGSVKHEQDHSQRR